MVRTLMDAAGVEGRRTGKLVEEHTPIVRDAMHAFLDKKILERVGFAEREDLVRVTPAAAGVILPAGVSTPASATAGVIDVAMVPSGAETLDGVEPPMVVADRIFTTETEVAVFEYVRRRLPFLMDREEALFANLEHLYPRDFKTRFTVCYKQDRNGRLFNFSEMVQGPRYRFEFPDTGSVINTDDFRDIDQELLATFLKRVAELG
jgi:hypothetical protein